MDNGFSRGAELRQFVAVVGIVVAGYLLAQAGIAAMDPKVGALIMTLVEAAILACFASLGLWFTIVRRLRAQGREQQFAATLHTALQMGSTESSTYDVISRALTVAGVQARTRLLLADSSEAHLKPVLDTGEGDASCTVVGPFDCPAVRRTQTTAFRDATALDVCPWLVAAQAPGTAASGAVCVPLTVVGRAIGVLQVAGPAASLPRAGTVQALETIAEQGGTRIGMLRVMEQTHLQAATDPLTGLLNRRSLENYGHDLFRGHSTFALAMGDLDHFKQLNDTHGHDAGDRALRVFARTLRSVLRNEDLVARYGGEEFVVLFPGQTVETAAGAMERVREALALAVAAGTIPSFTASFGVASSDDADTLDELLRTADNALFQAKRQGRNRVVADRANSVQDPAS